MKGLLKNYWLNEMLQDFPKYRNSIGSLQDSIDTVLELAQDYCFCKHQIRMLRKGGKLEILQQYQDVLKELEAELELVLHNNTLDK